MNPLRHGLRSGYYGVMMGAPPDVSAGSASVVCPQEHPPRTMGVATGPVKGIGLRSGGGLGQHDVMPDLLGNDGENLFDPDLKGALPDLVCAGGWKYQYSEGERVLPVTRAEAVLSRPADAECPELWVWLAADVLSIFRFWAVEGIDFDVDLRELQGQE